MPLIQVNGSSLYYEDYGEGTPLFLIHGMYGNHATWYQQVTSLSDRYRLVTLDLRGFGLSEDLNALGSGGSVGDMACILDHVGIETTILVGQSMGGAACLAFAVAHPDRVKALVLSGSLGGVQLPEQIATRQAELAKQAEGLSLSQRMLASPFLKTEPSKAELFRQIIGFNRGASRYFSTGTRPRTPTLEQLQKLASRIPILLMVGDQDVVQPPEVVTAIAGLLPGAETSVIAASGHSAYFEQPEAFNTRLREFVESVLSREQPSVGSAAL